MIRPHATLPPSRRFGLWFVFACILLVRVFTAPGLMPERAADGTITLSICSPASQAPARLDIPLGREDGGDGETKHCPFAVAVHHAALPDVPVLAVKTVQPAPITPARLGALSFGAFAPLPPATGPPALTA